MQSNDRDTSTGFQLDATSEQWAEREVQQELGNDVSGPIQHRLGSASARNVDSPGYGSRPRLSWDDYFFNIAEEVATRSTCRRRQVGAIIVRDKRILATGYNGSLPGLPHCEEVGCLIVNNHCKRTVHAEVNAVAQAARHGVAINASHMYVTVTPCEDCVMIAKSAGVLQVFFRGDYPSNWRSEIAPHLLGVQQLRPGSA